METLLFFNTDQKIGVLNSLLDAAVGSRESGRKDAAASAAEEEAMAESRARFQQSIEEYDPNEPVYCVCRCVAYLFHSALRLQPLIRVYVVSVGKSLLEKWWGAAMTTASWNGFITIALAFPRMRQMRFDLLSRINQYIFT